MQCPRCRGEFDAADLRQPPLWLRIWVLPFFVSRALFFREVNASYCGHCRRSVNAALFFVWAMFVVFALGVAVERFIPEEIRHAHARQQEAERMGRPQ